MSTHLAKGRGRLVVIADVDGGGASVALARTYADAPAEILAAERVFLSIETRTEEATIAGIGTALVEAGNRALQSYRAHYPKAPVPRKLYCIVHAPWVRSQTVHARNVFKEDVVITRSLIEGLAKQTFEHATAFNAANLLEASAVKVELNGYQTGAPEGKKAHSLEVATLLSECDPRVRTAAQAALQQVFPHLTPTYRSGARALLATLRSRTPELDCVVIELLREATMLMVVRGGEPTEHRAIPEGVRTILARIAPNGMPEETLSLLHMLDNDACSTTVCDSTRSAIAKAEPELVRIFGEGMSACATSYRLPNALVLVAPAELLPMLTTLFLRIDFGQFTRTTRPFTVETVSTADLAERVQTADGVTLDPELAVAVAFVGSEEWK